MVVDRESTGFVEEPAGQDSSYSTSIVFKAKNGKGGSNALRKSRKEKR